MLQFTMERRKSKLSKILHTFDLIVEEKLSIQDNLDRVLEQVSKEANHLKTNENLKQRDISEVQKCILDVLKQFSEINSLLEIMIEDIPVEKSEGESSKKTKEETSFRLSSRDNFDSGVIIQTADTPRSEIASQIPVIPELPSTTEVENGDYDIQSVRKSLCEFSEKLGLNRQNLSDMKDYYDKPSVSLPVVSPEMLSTSCVGPRNQEYPERNFEIPEKDTNTSQEYTEAKCLDRLGDTDTSQGSSISMDCCLKDEYLESSSPLLCASNNSSICTEMGIPPMGVVVKEEKNDHSYTALKKLNNYKSKVDENPESPIAVDIKLKPSGSVIQNFILEKKSKKKKDKKIKNKEKVFYELKTKETPKVGEECVICHIESPVEFYLHIVDDITVLIDEMGESINNFCKHNKTSQFTSKEEALIEVGTYCLAYNDKYENWFRAEILDGYKNEKHDKVLVRDVDRGNKCPTSFKNLRMLTEEICSIPMLAIRCHFPLLYPPESTNFTRLTTWPVATIEALLNISGLFSDTSNLQYFEIVYVHRETNNSVAVDLYHRDLGDVDNTLGQILIDMGLAVQLADDYDIDNMDLEVFVNDIDNLEADNINEAITGYDPRDEARICRFTKRDGTCFKKHCKLEHVPLSKDGYTTDKEAIFSEAMYSLILPTVGTTVNILITGYIDSCRFFAQIINNPYNERKYIIDNDMYLLLQDMNSPKIIKTYESFKIPPALGEIVIIYHWKKWLRAIVREMITGDNGEITEVQLFMLDLGEYKKAPIKDLRKVKPQFLKLPFQAVECYIHNYQMKKNCSQANAKRFFSENLYFHNFIARTMSSNLPLKVDLKNQNGMMVVGQILAEKGFAERRRVDLNVDDNCVLDLY